MKQPITEENNQDILECWRTAAKLQTLDTIHTFIKELALDYTHDYGTICHAMAAAAVGAIYALEHSEQGGITGFQAGVIQWEIVRLWGAWGTKDAPMRFVDFTDFLYPQYKEDNTAISTKTWAWLQKRAIELLSNNPEAHPDVIAHWRSIIAGVVPFGYHVIEK